MYYPCSENKDADQLRGYREADLRVCFRPCKLLVFSRTGSDGIIVSNPGPPPSIALESCSPYHQATTLPVVLIYQSLMYKRP